MTAITPDDAVFIRERSMDGPEVHTFAGGQVAVISRRSPAKETSNEDVAALIPYDASSGILLVADGAGGMRGGAQASSIALHELTAAIEIAARDGTSLREAVLDGIEAANREITTLAIGAATTVVVAEVRGNHLRPYHVGDSGILAVGQKGKLKLQTVFHSPTGYAVESGLINERQALKHDQRHLVSNVIGAPEMRIEMGAAIELSAKDTVLLATDGLFDNLRTPEIVELLRKGPLEQAITDLSAAAGKRMRGENANGKADDMTIVGFRLE